MGKWVLLAYTRPAPGRAHSSPQFVYPTTETTGNSRSLRCCPRRSLFRRSLSRAFRIFASLSFRRRWCTCRKDSPRSTQDGESVSRHKRGKSHGGACGGRGQAHSWGCRDPPPACSPVHLAPTPSVLRWLCPARGGLALLPPEVTWAPLYPGGRGQGESLRSAPHDTHSGLSGAPKMCPHPDPQDLQMGPY